jgi:hypothetical protein
MANVFCFQPTLFQTLTPLTAGRAMMREKMMREKLPRAIGTREKPS